MSDSKLTAVLGSSVKPERYSNKAIIKLREYGHPVHALGIKEGQVVDVSIQIGKPQLDNVHTVTMYVGKQNQEEYIDYIRGLKPNRVIFNPGTENAYFRNLLENDGVEVVEYCTLVMLDAEMF